MPHCSGSVVACWLLPEGLLQASCIYSVHEPLLGRPPGSRRATLATPFLLSSLLIVHFQNRKKKPAQHHTLDSFHTLFRALSSFEDPTGWLGESAGLIGPECVRGERRQPQKWDVRFLCCGRADRPWSPEGGGVLCSILTLSPVCREFTQMAFVYFFFRTKSIESITKTLASCQIISQVCHLAAGALTTHD